MRTFLTAVLCLCACVAAAHEHEPEPHTGHGQHYYAFIDDFHAHPSTTDATGEIFLTLNDARTELAYRIELHDGLGLKPNPADRTEPDDILGIHLHLHVPDAFGPHVLNIFGLATYNLPAEEDGDVAIDYNHRTVTGIWDDGDATINPETGEPYLPFFPLTSKPLSNWLHELEAGELMVAVHTVETGFPVMAIHGHISPVVPEPTGFAIAAMLLIGLMLYRRRKSLGLVVLLIMCGTAQAQPSAVGQWTGVFSWGQAGGVEAVHLFMLPTGKVMFWAYDRTSVGLWNPVTSQFSATGLPSYNPFCSGHAWLADGRLLVAGGHISNDNGEWRATAHNPFTGTWNNLPDMPSVPLDAPAPFIGTRGDRGRWYPSATTLGNGDILVMTGSLDGNQSPDENPLPQVYEAANNTWRNLTGAYKSLPLYERTFLNPDGRVVSTTNYSGSTDVINTSGTGSWTHVTNTAFSGLANYGSAVMYEPGKIVAFGGGDPPSSSIRKIDFTVANPTWTSAGSMITARRQHSATLLADGKVLVTGGSSQSGFNTLAGAVAQAEIWNPETGQITTMASASSVYRGYHSTSILLPDARVLMAGGTHDTGGNLNAEIYSPPYLFQGARPTITSAPASAKLGYSYFVATPDAASIEDVTFIVPGAVTHGQNWTQRINHLEFETVPGGLAVTLPSNPNEAPPGYYMLFLINGSGVPSVASWVRADLPGTGLAGDFNADDTVDQADYVFWRKRLGSAYTYADFVDWRRHFGETSGGSAGSVPEPNAALLLGVLAALAAGARFTAGRLRLRTES